MKVLRLLAASVAALAAAGLVWHADEHHPLNSPSWSAVAASDPTVYIRGGGVYDLGYGFHGTDELESLVDRIAAERQNGGDDLQPAPGCVFTQKENGFVTVYNSCPAPYGQRVKVTLTGAPDTACTSIDAGSSVNLGYSIGRIFGVYLC